MPTHAVARTLFARVAGRFLGDERGAALVETAIALPMFLMLATGFFEFGRLVHHHQQLENAARDAARFLSRVSVIDQDIQDSCADSAGTVVHQARNVAMYGNIQATGTPLLSYWPTQGYGTICFEVDNRAVTMPDGTVEVISVVITQINVVYQDTVMGLFGLTAPTMTARHEQRWIGS